MLKKTAFFTLMLLGMACSAAMAQYDGIRFPQKSEEVALYKKLKVMAEYQYAKGTDGDRNYKARAFDSGGRIIADVEYAHRKYYIYDDKGRVTSYLDSSYKDDVLKVEEYQFTYDKNGMLTSMAGTRGRSVFTFDPAGRTLTEVLTVNDTDYRAVYHLSRGNRVAEAIMYSPEGYRKGRETHEYTDNGILFRESIAQYGKEEMDSILTLYQFRDKRASSKYIFHRNEFLVMNEGTGKPQSKATAYDVGNFKYTYDKKGRLAAEEYTNSALKMRSYFKTWKYNDDGLIIQSTVKEGPAEPFVFRHEYQFAKP